MREELGGKLISGGTTMGRWVIEALGCKSCRVQETQRWAHSRDYGVLVANPFPVDVKANRGLETVVDPGTVFRLQFGVQVHDSANRDAYDPKKAYQRYLAQP